MRIATLTLATLLLTACSHRIAGVSIPGDVQNSYQLAEQWFTSQMRDKGIFNYLYYPKDDVYPEKNNAIRQLMASRLLAEIAREQPEVRADHRKNIQFFLTNWYQEEDGVGKIVLYDKSKLGSNAMAVRTLVYSPFFNAYKDQARALVNGILQQMNDNGSFEPWLIEPDYQYDKDYMLTFYSGEAVLALVDYYEATGDEEILEAAIKSQDFYVTRYVDKLKENYYPAYVPWHTQSLNKLYKITGNERYKDAIFTLNDKLLELLDVTNFIGRFYNPATPQYGSPHSSSDGVYTEGLVYALEIAKITRDQEHIAEYEAALKLALHNLFALQYNIQNSSHFERPDRVIGGFMIGHDKSGLRIDCAQHTMDAYRKILEIH